MSGRSTSRREFLKAAAAGAGAGVLATSGLGAAAREAHAVSAVRTPAFAPSGTLWGLQYEPHVQAYKRLAALFKKETGATIAVQPQAWPLDTKIIAALAAGTQPDVACILGSASVALYIHKALVPVQHAVFAARNISMSKTFLGDSLPAFSWKGQILGVPVESNQVGSMVNIPAEDVRAAGLAKQTPPLNGKIYWDSYQTMWDVSKALITKRGPKVRRWGISSEGWEMTSLTGIMRSLGTPWWDLEAKKFNFASPAGIHALQLLVETPVKMGIETELSDTGINAALQGKVAIVRGNGTPATSEGLKLGYHYELAGAPRVNPAVDPLFVGEGGWGFAALQRSKNPNLALSFLGMMASDAGQLEYAKIYGGLLGIAWAPMATDYRARFADSSPSSSIVKAAHVYNEMAKRTVYVGEQFGYYQIIGGYIGNAAQAIREGKKTAAQAAATIQKQTEAQYKQYLLDVQHAG